VLEQLGVEAEHIDSFASLLEADGHVFIPKIPIRVDGVDKVFSLMSTYTKDPSFSYLNGVQGQFVDRTAEWDLRKEREKLLEEKLRDRELIEDKTRQLERLASRVAKYLSP
jgi:adenylate cyclase